MHSNILNKKKQQNQTQAISKQNREDIHETCFDFQKDIILWAARGGQRAIFASFGMGKTLIQLELKELLKHHQVILF